MRLTDLDLSKMMRELQKLILYGQNQQQSLLREVEQLVPKTLEHNIFDMTQYILKGKTEQAKERGTKVRNTFVSFFKNE